MIGAVHITQGKRSLFAVDNNGSTPATNFLRRIAVIRLSLAEGTGVAI